MTGGIASEIPEIANAFKRQDTIFHTRAASAASRARLP
jgi:cysteine sulfinate desulfinase/cysteine desulfurase-like protein